MSWMPALAGGVLIGLAATLLLWLTGRVAGVSGIAAGLLFPRRGELAWRAAFLLGLVLAGGAAIGLLPGIATPRSLVAVLVFMATAVATTWVVRHAGGRA